MFIDFENLALGFKDRTGRFEIKFVLKRLLEKGKIVAKKAYCDWSRFNTYTASLHESAIELIEIPKRGQTGKNSADIRLCVDAMDLAYSKLHIDTFVIVSGDSDFSPLVSKLKELGKHVIGIGMNASTSALLRDNCDEFIYYEDLVPVADAAPKIQSTAVISDARRNAFNLLFEALIALRRDDKEFLGAAMIKNTICRMHPGFNESQFGYKSFSALLQDAAKEGLLELTLHQKAGTWVVAKFGEEMKVNMGGIAPTPVAPIAAVAPTTAVAAKPQLESAAPILSVQTAADRPHGGRSHGGRPHGGRHHHGRKPLIQPLPQEVPIDTVSTVVVTIAPTEPNATEPRTTEPGRIAEAPTKPIPVKPAVTQPVSTQAEKSEPSKSAPVTKTRRPPAKRPAATATRKKSTK